MEQVNFVASSDFEQVVYPRYRVIISRTARIGLIIFMLIIIADAYFIISDPNFVANTAKGLPQGERKIHYIAPYVIMFGLIIWPVFLWMGMSEKYYSKKLYDFMLNHFTKWEDKDYPGSTSITFRTYYRYCASLEMTGKDIIIKDKVTGLVNGDLDLKGIGRRLKNDIVRFKLSVDQITTVWVAKDLIVMRFCWGPTYHYAWDVIINRSNFEKGTDEDFIKYMKKELYAKQIRYDPEQVRQSNGEARLGNFSTNYWGNEFFGFLATYQVKVFNVRWGPFKKRSDKNREKEIQND